MSTQIQWRRGTTAQHTAFTGVIAEATVDTDKKTLVVHDGVTAGGSPLATEAKTTEKTSNTGSAKLPVGTTVQRDGSPADGYLRYNTTLSRFEGYGNSTWGEIGGGAKGGSTDKVFYENDKTVTTDYTITTGKNAVTAGPVTISNGITVTIPDGSTWTVV